MSAYLTAPLQLEKICRACLSEKGDMKPLFGACLDEMMLSFANIQVNVGVIHYTCHAPSLSYVFVYNTEEGDDKCLSIRTMNRIIVYEFICF